MKKLLLVLLLFIIYKTKGQSPHLRVTEIRLGNKLNSSTHEFSGLAIHNGRLYLLPEGGMTSSDVIYSLLVDSLDKLVQNKDGDRTSAEINNPRVHQIKNLDVFKTSSIAYDGLEALLFKDNFIYFSIEAPKHSNSKIIRGKMGPKASITIDPGWVVKLPNEVAHSHSISNAGFESLALLGGEVFAVNEYNNLNGSENKIFVLRDNENGRPTYSRRDFIEVPFRITDLSNITGDSYYAINRITPGPDSEAYQRRNTPRIDSAYSRILKVTRSGERFRRTFLELDRRWWGYNWEGIAVHNNGFFLISDEYAGEGENRTVLLYVEVF